MLWDPPVRAFDYLLGADQAAAAASIMAFFIMLPLIFTTLSSPSSPDLLLFSIPLLNTAFFGYNAAFGNGVGVIDTNLRVFVLTLCAFALVLYGKACGVFVGGRGGGGGGMDSDEVLQSLIDAFTINHGRGPTGEEVEQWRDTFAEAVAGTEGKKDGEEETK
jgi:hypothetical protein